MLSFKSQSEDGRLIVNNLCIVCEDGGDLEQADPGEILGAANTWLFNLYKACLRSSYTVNELQLRGIRAQYGVEETLAKGETGTLTAGTGTLPWEVCMVLSLKTNYAARSGRGRMFIPSPLSSSYLTSPSQWSTGSAYWNAVHALGEAIKTPHNFTFGTGGAFSADLVANVYSRAHNDIHEIRGYVQRQQPHWLRSRSTAP